MSGVTTGSVTTSKRTILLVHGLWLTPLAWEHWIEHYTAAGHRVMAPAWPGMESDVESLHRNPTVMNGLGMSEIVDHYDRIVRDLDTPPIIIGHSLGGLVTQILLDRGLGSAGVALHPAPATGSARMAPSALRATLPVLANPHNRTKTVALSSSQWHYAFTNTFGQGESRAAYFRYHVPASGRPLWQTASATFVPNAATAVDDTNDTRPPLLCIAGGRDHLVPPSMVKATVKRQRRSAAVTDYREYPGRPHFTLGAPGWPDVADDVLTWALRAGG